MSEDEPSKSAETFKDRAERIIRYEQTADPNIRALAEERDLVGTQLTMNETVKLCLTYTKAVKVALLDLAEQLDERFDQNLSGD